MGTRQPRILSFVRSAESGFRGVVREIEELRLGLETAYIDGNVASNLMYKPQFVSNNYKEGKKHIPGEILTTNREWNTKVVSTEQGEVAQEIVDEFEELWNSEHALTFSELYIY